MKREVGDPYSLDPELSAGHIMSHNVTISGQGHELLFFLFKCSSLLPTIAMSKS